jgi:hypothetical protein
MERLESYLDNKTILIITRLSIQKISLDSNICMMECFQVILIIIILELSSTTESLVE